MLSPCVSDGVVKRIGRQALCLAAVGVATLWPSAAAAQTAPSQSGPAQPTPVFKIEVIEATPLPGLDLKLDQIPAPVQSAVSADIEASGSLDYADFLNRRFGSVFINEMQGNP